ncbi:MAG: transglycosylase domain-containing protein [Bacteroidales bacterium]|nr:MAG: transglycosylase domain-containing protein [Bacteroidales bacterium]
MNKTKKSVKRFNILFWAVFASPFIFMIIIFILISGGKLGYMPDFEELENPNINLATQVVSEDGVVLGSFYYKNQNRTFVEYEDLPQHLIDALIATEDIRYYKHSGIDARGLARVLFRTILGGHRRSGGGSTISQQLAKNLFPRDTTRYNSGFKRSVKLVITKLREWVTAVKLEKSYTKQEIISMYFNQVDFLYKAVGIKSAAKVYFNTSPDSLKVEEAALLVGMAKNPTVYNPLRERFKDMALRRRNIVLSQMSKYGFISDAESDSLKNLPIVTDYQKISHNLGLATYFREFIRRTLTAEEPERRNYFLYDRFREDSIKWENDPLFGWCNKNKKPDNSPYDLYTDGLKIHTTINAKLQQYAEEAVREYLGDYLQDIFFKEKKGRRDAPFSEDLDRNQIDNIIWRAIANSDRGRKLRRLGVSKDSIYKVFNTPIEMTVFSWKGDRDTVMTPLDSIIYYKHFLQSGVLSMNPVTGDVRAYVGGLDFRYFKYDHVTQGKRQAGSTFKPFLYILAMQEGFSPCQKVLNTEQVFYDQYKDTVWIPNSNSREKDLNQMRTLKWGLAVSENNISAWLVKRFKPQPIANIAYKMGIRSYIDPVPPMIFGTSDMSVEEMVGAYATFANKGIHTTPLYVTRIEDKNGNLLASFQPERIESISEKTAFLMLNLMEGAINFGTAARLRYRYNFTAQISGKTGTTQNHSDGWFMGITPKLITGVWVGAEDRSVHFNDLAMGSGTNMALPVWAHYMQKIYVDSLVGITQEDVFEEPADFDIVLDCDRYDIEDPEFLELEDIDFD